MTERDEEQFDLLGGEIDEDSMLANLDEIGEVDARRWPQRLTEMIAVVESSLKHRHGLPPEQAARQAQDTVMAIAHYFGGHQVYLPFGRELERAIRDSRIWRDFTGNNIDELAQRYKLSTVMIYGIIARQRRLHTKKIQGNLFE